MIAKAKRRPDVSAKLKERKPRTRQERWGVHLQQLRIAAGYDTLQSFCDALQAVGQPYTPAGIGHIEAGRRSLRVDDLYDFAQVLKVKPSKLLPPI